MRGKLHEAVLDLKRVTAERDRLIDISNDLRADLDAAQGRLRRDNEHEREADVMLRSSAVFSRTPMRIGGGGGVEDRSGGEEDILADLADVTDAHDVRPATTQSLPRAHRTREPADRTRMRLEEARSTINLAGQSADVAERRPSTAQSDRATRSQLQAQERMRARQRAELAAKRRSVRNWNVRDESLTQ